MTDLKPSTALVATGDLYLGGLNWNKEHGLQQAVVGLSADDACVLGVTGRLDRVAAAGGQKGRATMLPPVGQGAPRLLLSGTESTVAAMKDELDQVLGKGGRSVPIHPYDTAKLRKPTRKLADFEAGSGCRMVLEDQQKLLLRDPIVTPRHHRVCLYGDSSAQARALGLLAPHLTHSDAPLKEDTLATDYTQACEDWLGWKNMQEGNNQPIEAFFRRMPDMVPHATMDGDYPVHLRRVDATADGPGCFYSFDPAICGAGLEFPRGGVGHTVVRQRPASLAREKAPLHGLVVAGKGVVLPYMAGSFFALKVLKMNLNCKSQGGVHVGIPRGGTRIGVSTMQPESPPPATLLTKPKQSWVLGRGFVRGPDGKTSRCVAADIDGAVTQGDEVGFLVTKDKGAVALFRRADQYAEWTCLAHWDAKVTDVRHCFALLELSGSIVEVELLHGRQAPPSVERDLDEIQLPKRVWP